MAAWNSMLPEQWIPHDYIDRSKLANGNATLIV